MCFEKYKGISGIFSILVILTILQDTNAKPPQKIKGGENAYIEEFPSMVSIRIWGTHDCGGSLISLKHVLTAAHCVGVQVGDHYEKFRDMNAFSINAGSNKSDEFEVCRTVSEVHVHRGYTGNISSAQYDLAILTLSREFSITDKLKPIALPSKDILPNTVAYVVGWGALVEGGRYSQDLHKAETKVLSNEECEILANEEKQDEEFCGLPKYGTGICRADSGGPLIANNEIIGIAASSIGCGRGGPNFYVRVYSHINWIKTIIGV